MRDFNPLLEKHQNKKTSVFYSQYFEEFDISSENWKTWNINRKAQWKVAKLKSKFIIILN